MIRKANCKINIGLDVLCRREDGYHELATVMIPVYGLYDVDLTICLANHMTKIVKAGRKRELVRSFLSAHPI